MKSDFKGYLKLLITYVKKNKSSIPNGKYKILEFMKQNSNKRITYEPARLSRTHRSATLNAFTKYVKNDKV